MVDGLDLIEPAHYGAKGAPHQQWSELRTDAPVSKFSPDGFEDFWAVTGHPEIIEASSKPDVFCNGEGIVLLTEDQTRAMADGDSPFSQMKTIIEMDPPDHRMFRKVASGFFTPRGIQRLDEIVTESATALIDGLDDEGEVDFVAHIAQRHPLRVLCTILGVPREQEDHLLELTTQLFASEDPELQREGDDRKAATAELGMEFFNMFNSIIEDRRANPRDDLATMLATATLENGEPLGLVETLGYYLIVFNAGHDTTRHSLAGGISAFLEFPDQLQRLRTEPDIIKSAVEEVVRWSAPVNYMKRTATQDTELGGVQIAKGERLALFYASANRDARVFENPNQFDIGRTPNRHLGFGWAEHYCLGAHLARASIAALLEQMRDKIEILEPAGDTSYVASSFVFGYKTLPVHYRKSA